MDARRDARRFLLVSLALVAVSLAVFWPLAQCGFVDFDDTQYVTQNERVLRGLTWDNVLWAFRTLHFGYYYPLTWLSHMADVQLFGLRAGAHHLHSLALHMASAVLLLLFLRRTTGALWRSALVAALFAVHPLHVESVAWISERKDVLSTLFMMLALLTYAWYAQRPGWRRYLLVAVTFVCGLMAKPMLVTFPFVLLLLDLWPLKRLTWPPGAPVPPEDVPCRYPRLPLQNLLAEKVPLLALSAAAAYLTVVAQRGAGAITGLEALPLGTRLANATVAYATYLAKMAVPSGLAVLYPYPKEGVPPGLLVASIALLLLISLLALRKLKTAPYLAVGWAWYLGTLVPVIGLVQVGRQASADRYTYVPLIGVFIAVVWGAADLVSGRAWTRRAAAALAGCALVALMGCAYLQVRVWTNTLTLFGHAVRVTQRNVQALAVYGLALAGSGHSEEGAAVLLEAVKVDPLYPDAFGNLGIVYLGAGHSEQAESCFTRVIQLAPSDARGHAYLGLTLLRESRLAEAVAPLREALRLNPSDRESLVNLGWALVKTGKPAEGEACLREAVARAPQDSRARDYLVAAQRAEREAGSAQ